MPLTLWCLWIALNVLSAVALVVVFRRRSLNSLPLFLSFLGYCVLQVVVAVVIRSRSATGSWHICVLVWLFYLLLPEEGVDTSKAVVQMPELEPHSQELQRLLQR